MLCVGVANPGDRGRSISVSVDFLHRETFPHFATNVCAYGQAKAFLPPKMLWHLTVKIVDKFVRRIRPR